MSNEVALSYASLILADAEVDVTADKLHTLVKAAGFESLEPIWANIFAKALEGKDLQDLISSFAVGAAPAGGAAAAGGAASAEAGEAAAEKEEEKVEEESDEEMGMGLFD